MNTLLGNKMWKYEHLCVIITDTDLAKQVQKDKRWQTVVTECDQSSIITVLG